MCFGQHCLCGAPLAGLQPCLLHAGRGRNGAAPSCQHSPPPQGHNHTARLGKFLIALRARIGSQQNMNKTKPLCFEWQQRSEENRESEDNQLPCLVLLVIFNVMTLVVHLIGPILEGENKKQLPSDCCLLPSWKEKAPQPAPTRSGSAPTPVPRNAASVQQGHPRGGSDSQRV